MKRCVAPSVSPALARRRARFSISTGGSLERRALRCACRRRCRISSDRRRPSSAARQRERPGAGVERELERPQRERLVDPRRGLQDGRRRRAEQRHLQAAVLLQFEAVVGGHHLADGEADLLAAVVDAAPLRPRCHSVQGRSPGWPTRPADTPSGPARPWSAPRPPAPGTTAGGSGGGTAGAPGILDGRVRTALRGLSVPDPARVRQPPDAGSRPLEYAGWPIRR